MAASLQRDVFDFFRLPRELRDFVYDELPTSNIKANIGDRGDGVELHAEAQNLPSTILLLLSRQFYREYQPVAHEKPKLAEREKIESVHHAPEVMAQACKVLSGLHLWASFLDDQVCEATASWDYEVGDELAMHMRWINTLCERMPQLQQLSLDVLVQESKWWKRADWEGGTDKRRFLDHLRHMTSLPYLAALIVSLGNRYDDPAKVAVVKWDAATSKSEDIAA